jgi:hypothetical protein
MRTIMPDFGSLTPLRDRRLLEAWDRASTAGDAGRASALLSAACPGTSPAQWDVVAITEVNLQLVRLRRISFGSSLTGQLPCSECGAQLEFNIDVPQIIQRLEETMTEDDTADWTSGNDRFSMRAANNLDLVAVSTQAGPEDARLLLLERCTQVNDGPASDEIASAALRASETVALETFTRLHQAAEITCRVPCVACGHAEVSDLDMARFLWAEVRHNAGKLLREIHELASVYGWSEEAIINMPAHRRERYLEMIRS